MYIKEREEYTHNLVNILITRKMLRFNITRQS